MTTIDNRENTLVKLLKYVHILVISSLFWAYDRDMTAYKCLISRYFWRSSLLTRCLATVRFLYNKFLFFDQNTKEFFDLYNVKRIYRGLK